MKPLPLWFKPWPKFTHGIILILLSCLIVWLRLHSLNEPLERDLSTYAYIGQRLLAGEKLYTYLIDIKPPGIYLAYMLAEWIWGYTTWAIVLLGISFTLLAMIFLFLTLKRLAGGITASLGALFWSLASNAYLLQANLPNTETFINAFLLLAIWALVGYQFHPRRRTLCLAGGALALASFFKLHAIFFGLALAGYFFFPLSQFKLPGAWRALAQRLVYLAAPGVLLWLGTFGYFFILGRGEDFYNIVFVSVSHYAGPIGLNLWHFFNTPSLLLPRFFKEILMLVVLAVAWLFLPYPKQLGIPRSFFVLVALASLAMVGSTPFYYPHYYQLLLPSLCLLSALFFPALAAQLPAAKSSSHFLLLGLGLITLGYLFYFQGYFLTLPAEKISSLKYGPVHVQERALGEELKALTRKEETIFQWGKDPGLYFYSQRAAASGLVMIHLLTFAPPSLAAKLRHKVQQEILAAPPAFFIVNPSAGNLEQNPFYSFLCQNYYYRGNQHTYLVFEKRSRILDPGQR